MCVCVCLLICHLGMGVSEISVVTMIDLTNWQIQSLKYKHLQLFCISCIAG